MDPELAATLVYDFALVNRREHRERREQISVFDLDCFIVVRSRVSDC
jgi:hypothetical protein